MSNDSFGNNLVTGILIDGIIRQGQEERARDRERGLREEQEKIEKYAQSLAKKNQELADNSSGQSRAIVMLRQEVEYYKELLTKPMQVIAEHNGDFKKTYEEQQALLADWMVSQKAFKELAIQFGFDAHGHTPEQVIEMGLDKEIDVLESKNDPSHKTNFSDSTHPEPRRQALLEKAQKDKATRKAKQIRENSMLELNQEIKNIKGVIQ